MHFIVVMLASLVLSACTWIEQTGYLTPTVKNNNTTQVSNGKSTNSNINIVDAQNTNVVAAENRAIAPYFKVAFYTENNPEESTTHGFGKVIINSTLVGVDDSTLQRITDQAYTNFVTQMMQQGIEVLPITSLENSFTYQKFKGKSQYKDEALFGPDAVYVTPTGLKVPDTNITRGLEVSSIMKEMNASVMDITLYVTYLTQTVESTLKVVTDISVDQALAVIPGSVIQFYGLAASKCQGYCSSAVAHARLKQSVRTVEQVGELIETANTTNKASNMAIAALAWLIPGKTTEYNSSDRYTLHADATKYEQAAVAVLKEATEQLVGALVTAQ